MTPAPVRSPGPSSSGTEARSEAGAEAGAGAGRARRWAPWVALAGGLALIAVVTGPESRGGGPPLDPTSTRPSGTKALVDTLRQVGADVRVETGVANSGATTALVLVDSLDDRQRAEVTEWVEAGGTLVVTDVSSPLSPTSPAAGAQFAFVEPELRRRCDVAALAAVNRVNPAGAVLLDVPVGTTGCFSVGSDAWMVIARRGRGNVVALGGAGAFVNGRLGETDNALLAVTLLAPTRGDRVVVLRPPLPGTGDRNLIDLISPRVKLALLQLGVAFLIVVLWRARRLGRPVREPQVAELAGSEIVVATGQLMQRAKGRSQAAAILRAGIQTAMADRLGLPRQCTPEQVAEATAARTGLPAAEVLHVLAGPPPVNEDELMLLAQSIEALRRDAVR